MEEEIKKIEYFLDLVDETIDENIEVEEIEIKELRQAIENLIKGYNYMCKLYYDLGSNYCDLDEKNKKLEKENQSYRDYFGTPPCYDNADYIPKSKVRDKIEELKEEYEYLGNDNKRVNKFEIYLLEELLQEGDK